MRSIRLSLVVYFLLLLALALGCVSVVVYRTTAATLEEKQASTAQLLQSQWKNQCDEARDEVDRRILRQAQNFARNASSSSFFHEIHYPLGALSAPLMAQGYLNIPLWTAEGFHPPLAYRLHRLRPLDIVIESAEDFLPIPEMGETTEYFQTFRIKGQPLQRSESMANYYFTLDTALLENAKVYQEHFDDAYLGNQRVRRVTLKVPVQRFRTGNLPWPLELFRPPKGGPRFPVRPTGPPPPRPSIVDAALIFIQYASDTGPLDKRLAEFQDERDERLAQLTTETRENLRSLRERLLWIGLAAFASLVAGGWTLVWLGLKPLARLSEAVSEVSPKDFHLNVDVNQLPRELQPIAGRLAQTLEQLGKAFAREKQAAADISHELRTPLAALLATLDVGLRKSRSAAEYRELLVDCKMSGEHMAVLVERLLALARLDAGADQLRLQTFDASEIAGQCADLIRPLAQAKGLNLRVQAGPAITLHSDPDKLREILTNLLHNAIEYNKPQGSIDLSVISRAGQAVLEVRDTGIGIAPAAQNQIFERFFRADPSRHADTPHAGLGLAIVKSYVDLMGGAIDLDSSPAGSTFRVSLPLNGRA